MRIRNTIFANSLACGLVGVVTTIALSQLTLPVALVIASVGLVGCAALSIWSSAKIGKGIRALHNVETQKAGQSTSFVEFDHVRSKFLESLTVARADAALESEQLADVRKLINKLDRRKEDRSEPGFGIAARLQDILIGYQNDLESNSRQATACSRELSRASQELVAGTESQFDTVERTSMLIEELSNCILSICDNAEQAQRSSSTSRNIASDGYEKFETVVGQMTAIRNQAATRERKLQALGQHTKDIEAIVKTIGSLSARTDLLAVNASIESVRAGEHGRGFAIVAEEVRALAEQSAQAVQDISHRIDMVQHETHQSIASASSEHDQLQSAIRCLNGLLESLEKLQGSSTTTEQELKAINSSTRKQLQLSRKVVTSLEQSADISKRNRTKAEGANWTATTLGKVGQQLEKFAEHFQPMQKSPRLQETDNVSDLDSTSSIESELVTQ